jgi:hypothetical protein
MIKCVKQIYSLGAVSTSPRKLARFDCSEENRKTGVVTIGERRRKMKRYELITDRNEQGQLFDSVRSLRAAIKKLPADQWCEVFVDIDEGEDFRILDRNLRDAGVGTP